MSEDVNNAVAAAERAVAAAEAGDPGRAANEANKVKRYAFNGADHFRTLHDKMEAATGEDALTVAKAGAAFEKAFTAINGGIANLGKQPAKQA